MNATVSKVLIGAICLVVGAGAGFLYSNVTASRRAEAAQAAFLSQLAAKDVANAQLQALNAQILAQNEALKGENAVIEAQRADLKRQLDKANADLVALQNAEPSYPELNNHPLVINLRLQLVAQDKRYSLAMEDIALANKEIANQKIQIVGLEQAYSNAMQMYLNSDGLLMDAARANARLVKQNNTLKRLQKPKGLSL